MALFVYRTLQKVKHQAMRRAHFGNCIFIPDSVSCPKNLCRIALQVLGNRVAYPKP
nr:MAG TPA: hypothetical protein [Caudoviricetes sp.]